MITESTRRIPAYLWREHRKETIVVASYLVALAVYLAATSWTDFLHMLYRQYAVHLPAAPFALLVAFFPLRLASRAKIWGRRLEFLAHPYAVILLASLFIFVREPFDAARGPWLKSYYDLAHWLFFLSISYWAMERWRRWQD